MGVFWKELLHILCEGSMYPAALPNTLTQTVDSSQVFERTFSQRQPKIHNKNDKNLGQKTIKDLQQECPTQNHGFLI